MRHFIVVGLVGVLSSAAWAQQREITIEGKTLSCGRVPIYRDAELPNLGMAIVEGGRKRIVVNTAVQSHMPKELKWFIFYHECGHIRGHLNEKKADEYAAQVAAEEGWLTRELIEGPICHSWGPMNAPASSTHPAPRDRCRALVAVADRVLPSGEPAVGTMISSGPAPRKAPAAVPTPPPAKVASQPVLSGERSTGFMMDDLDAVR